MRWARVRVRLSWQPGIVTNTVGDPMEVVVLLLLLFVFYLLSRYMRPEVRWQQLREAVVCVFFYLLTRCPGGQRRAFLNNHHPAPSY